jgi:hypothetical protein
MQSKKPGAAKKKVSKPVMLAPKKKTGEDALWGPATMRKRTAREMSATYRKKAQAGRLTAEERRKVTQREKARLMDKKGKITSRRFKGSM